ncbi:YCF48-related protein [Fluviicola chungangensis]|uniref:T9SS type A sorting domain-containing protein n=1 Tax=Fluviicola chungangensis TaxID=2597671 RepID=A0A556MR33_9FLAO|nr:YCF48-related protein [Fluviicola chungangensis]TSJ42396.1 T9SS type A sorting domain-containing protein [Fluviicola chungangensis]
MKKLTFLYLLISSGNLLSQTTWENVPQATQFSPTDIEFTDLNNGWATSINGYIAHTNDGGDTWSLQGSYNSYAATVGIDMLSSTHGYVVGGHSIYETTDGEHWDAIYTDSMDYFAGVSFVNDTLGIAYVAGYKILKTTNGGQTWDTIFFNFNGGIYKAQFVDENTIVAVGEDYGAGNIFVSHDSGLTWAAPQDASGLWLTDVFFTSNQNGHLVGQNGIYMTTTDGGLTWQNSTQFQNLMQPYPSVYFISETTGFVNASYGQCFRTTDGGATWTDLTVNGNRNFSSMYFVDAQHGWAASSVLTEIKRTSDAGLTWSSVYTGSGWGLTDVVFTSAAEGWSCGIRGTVLHTVDNGSTWSLIESPVQTAFLKIGAADPQNIWIVDEQGKAFHTPNGGTNWYYSTISQAGANLMDIDFPTPQVGYVAGPSYIYKTVNGGGNWTEDWYPGVNYMALDFLNADTGIVITTEQIFRTSDSAVTWSEITPTVGVHAYNDIAYPAIDTAYVVGYQGIILSTYDGGNTWTLQNSGTTSVLTDVTFSSSTHGRASGYDGTILVTWDAGVTWIPESTPAAIQISGITMTQDNSAWAAKADGNLLRFECSTGDSMTVNTYTLDPTSNCNGSVLLSSVSGESFVTHVTSQDQVVQSSINLSGLCEGYYALDGYNSCGNDLNGSFVIPVPGYFFGEITGFPDPSVVSYLGNVQEFCTDQIPTITYARLKEVSLVNSTTVLAFWELIRPSGALQLSGLYEVGQDGMYAIQLSLYCEENPFEGLVVSGKIYVDNNTVVLNTSELEMESLTIFPNPASDKITIRFQSATANLIIRDINGKPLLSKSVTSNEGLDLSGLSAGILLAEITTENGTTTKRIVKN